MSQGMSSSGSFCDLSEEVISKQYLMKKKLKNKEK